VGSARRCGRGDGLCQWSVAADFPVSGQAAFGVATFQLPGLNIQRCAGLSQMGKENSALILQSERNTYQNEYRRHSPE
jgi:hypothetical protein